MSTHAEGVEGGSPELSLSPSLTHILCHTNTLSLSLSHTHTLAHTHTHALSLSKGSRKWKVAGFRNKRGGHGETFRAGGMEEEEEEWGNRGDEGCLSAYRGTSLIRKHTPLGPYHRPMPRVLGES